MATTAAPTAPSPPSSPPQPQVLLVGIGGPTCSGKTTLTKHLLNLVRTHAGPRTSTFIVHQDDFAPPESSLVWNDRVGSADWDDPATSVEWARLRDTLAHVKATGALPATHSSHDELNPLPDLPVSADVQARLDDEFRGMFGGDHDTPTHIVFLDGFLLYYDRVVRGQIDLPVFLRIGRGLLRERRDARGGYVTAEGDCWKDPPLYFDEILWPSHLKAHAHLFAHGDVEAGEVITSNDDGGDGNNNNNSNNNKNSSNNNNDNQNNNKNDAASPASLALPPLRVVEAQDPPGHGGAKHIDEVILEGSALLLDALRQWARTEAKVK